VGLLRQRFSWLKVLLICALLGVAAASFSSFRRERHFIQVAGEGAVKVPISELKPGDAEFFLYRDRAGDQIRFLLARDSTGRMHAALDACQRCYLYHRGYSVSDDELICRFCGNHYKLEAMESGLGSCVPIKLSIQVVGQVAKIATAELERGRRLF
jgi:uncharacterized membrane protein